MTLGKRVQAARQHRKLTQAELAKRVGMSQQALSRLERDDNESSAKLAEIAIECGVSPAWLAREQGPMVVVHQESRGDDAFIAINGYAGGVALGDGSAIEEYAEAHKLKFRISSLRKQGLLGRPLEVYYGNGDSMEPNIRDGDAILVDRSDTMPRDDSIFLLESEDGAVVKRLEEIDGRWYVTSDNKHDPKWRKPMPMDGRKHFKILGRVRWIGRWEG